MKPRLNIYLDDATAAQLELAARRPGANKSALVNAALTRFFDPDPDRDWAALIRRIERLSKDTKKIERHQSVATETLALFIRYFLTVTPPMPEAGQASAHALGSERFEAFAAQVGRRLAQDRNLLNDVLQTIVEEKPDLFMVEPDASDPAIERTHEQQSPRSEPDGDDDDLPPLRKVVFADETDADDILPWEQDAEEEDTEDDDDH